MLTSIAEDVRSMYEKDFLFSKTQQLTDNNVLAPPRWHLT